MKNISLNLKTYKRILWSMMCSFVFTSAFGTQLSGSYTIDSAGTASSTVFKDFNSAVIYLTSASTRPDGGPSNSSPFGVSGPVVFDVQLGTYIEQVDITAIPGTSATNTVTFDGGTGNAATRIIQFTSSSSTNAHTLRFTGSSFVIVQNLTIKGMGSYSIGVHFYSSVSTFNITLKQCSVLVTIPTSGAAASSPLKAIAATNSNICTTGGATSGAAGPVYNIFIDSNYISGGNIGVFLSSNNSSSIPHNFSVRWNRLENVYATGLGASTSQGYLYEGNYIKMVPGNTASIGMQHSNGSTSGTQSYKVIGNTVENAGQYGITFGANNANSATAYPTLIVNNYFKPTFSNAAASAIYCTQSRNHRIYNNTILMNMAGGNGINLANSTNAGCIIKNNIVQLQASGSTGLCVVSGGINVDSCDYNVFMKNSTTSLTIVSIQATTYTTSNFIGGGGFNLNSTMADPLLISVNDPRPMNLCQKGQSTTWVVTDINRVARSIPPQIGCAEGAGGVAVDASILNFILPQTYPVSAGSQDIRVVIKNSGTNSLTSVNVSASLGAVTRTISWTGSLSSCQVDTVTFTGTNQLSLSTGSNFLRAWVDNPNFSVDSNATNDTISKTFCTPIAAGTYTIDTGAAGNFHSFTEVANILNCGGISGTGPVIFNVATGNYNEQILLGGILGTSAANPITFQSQANNPDSVLLAYNSSSSGNYVIKLAGASYITFRNISLTAQNSTYGIVCEFSGGASYDSIENCILTSQVVATTSSSNAVIFANPITGNYNVIRNNRIIGGSYGAYYYGTGTTAQTFNNEFSGNTVTDFYYMGLTVYYNTNARIIGNTLNSTSANTSTMYGIYVIYGDSALEIRNNKVNLPVLGTRYGIYMSTCRGTSAVNALICNNVVTIVGSATTTYGLYGTSCAYVRYYNNSVNINSSSTSSYAAYFSFTSTTYTGNIIRNNILSNMGAGYSVYYANPLYHSSDFNNLFTNGSLLVQVATPAGTFANLPAWRVQNSGDLNSISYASGFTTSTNLIPNLADTSSWSLNGRGIHIAGNSSDIAGNTRPTVVTAGVPDLGAYEFTPTCAPPPAIALPATPAAGITQSFLFAGDTIAKIAWDPYASIPSTIEVRQYSGVRPPSVDTTANNYMYSYVDVNAAYGYSNYIMSVFYRDSWLGTNPSESNLRLAQKSNNSASNPWTPLTGSTSSVDTIRNIISGSILFDYGLFTGTDNNNPLPVILAEGINATQVGKDVMVNWSTVSEINSNNFEIEVSYDGKNFSGIGTVKASGQSNQMIKYAWLHDGAFAGYDKALFYRIKMIDRDGSFEYSNTAVVVPKNGLKVVEVTAVPNPFNTITKLNITSQKDVNAVVTVTDITGKLIMSDEVQLSKGFNSVELNKLLSHHDGLYFVKVNIDNEPVNLKLLKVSK